MSRPTEQDLYAEWRHDLLNRSHKVEKAARRLRSARTLIENTRPPPHVRPHTVAAGLRQQLVEAVGEVEDLLAEYRRTLDSMDPMGEPTPNPPPLAAPAVHVEH